jgi:adenylate cyclase
MLVVVWEVGGKTQRFQLERSPVRVGRALDNDIVIPDISVSRYHAVIVHENGQWVIRDMGSRNGLRVQDRFVTEHVLRDGEQVWLGNVSLNCVALADERIEFQEAPGPEEPVEGTIIRPAADIALGRVEVTPQLRAPAPAVEVDLISSLVDVIQKLLSLHSLEDLLNAFMDLVFAHIPAERGFLLLYDEHLGELVPRVVRFRHPGSEGRITISRHIARKVFDERVAVLTLDAQADPRFAGEASVIMHGIRSVMCAPLWVQDRSIGVIFVDTVTRTVGFTQQHLQMFTLMANMAGVAIEQARLRASIQREQALRARLERYHSPAVVEQILADRGRFTLLEPQEREVTVLFADMVGFSSRAETMEPKQLTALLNDFLSELVEVVFEYEGTLDKFMGDAVMAFFGAPRASEDHALRAVQAAWAMRQRIQAFNERRRLTPPVQIRVGINTGKVVAGDIGSPRRVEYTVLGNTVNVASRLENFVAKPDQIVISEATYEQVQTAVEVVDLGWLDLKGLQQKVHAYELVRLRE